jgi:hypothetical protein
MNRAPGFGDGRLALVRIDRREGNEAVGIAGADAGDEIIGYRRPPSRGLGVPRQQDSPESGILLGHLLHGAGPDVEVEVGAQARHIRPQRAFEVLGCGRVDVKVQRRWLCQRSALRCAQGRINNAVPHLVFGPGQ